ncbi:unnamed protein product, partial [Chrysoparadoxa australica]
MAAFQGMGRKVGYRTQEPGVGNGGVTYHPLGRGETPHGKVLALGWAASAALVHCRPIWKEVQRCPKELRQPLERLKNWNLVDNPRLIQEARDGVESIVIDVRKTISSREISPLVMFKALLSASKDDPSADERAEEILNRVGGHGWKTRISCMNWKCGYQDMEPADPAPQNVLEVMCSEPRNLATQLEARATTDTCPRCQREMSKGKVLAAPVPACLVVEVDHSSHNISNSATMLGNRKNPCPGYDMPQTLLLMDDTGQQCEYRLSSMVLQKNTAGRDGHTSDAYTCYFDSWGGHNLLKRTKIERRLAQQPTLGNSVPCLACYELETDSQRPAVKSSEEKEQEVVSLVDSDYENQQEQEQDDEEKPIPAHPWDTGQSQSQSQSRNKSRSNSSKSTWQRTNSANATASTSNSKSNSTSWQGPSKKRPRQQPLSTTSIISGTSTSANAGGGGEARSSASASAKGGRTCKGWGASRPARNALSSPHFSGSQMRRTSKSDWSKGTPTSGTAGRRKASWSSADKTKRGDTAADPTVLHSATAEPSPADASEHGKDERERGEVPETQDSQGIALEAKQQADTDECTAKATVESTADVAGRLEQIFGPYDGDGGSETETGEEVELEVLERPGELVNSSPNANASSGDEVDGNG